MTPKILVAAIALSAAPLLSAQERADAGSRRVEGSWVRVDTTGVGSFGGLATAIPPAQLIPQLAAGRAAGAAAGAARGAAAAPARGPNPAGVPYIVVDHPCFNPARGNGAILVNPDSGGFHIIEHKDEVIIAGERGGVRHIYLDGRPHPPAGRWTATPAGHSTGKYEGNVLVIDTVGLTNGAVPGGGQRTAETRLMERLEVSADGKRMTITYTWTDPKIYQRPHIYTYTFDRILNGYAFEDWCDASDPAERQSIVPPVQR